MLTTITNLLCTCSFYLSRGLNQERAKWPFRYSNQASTCYCLSNHWK